MAKIDPCSEMSKRIMEALSDLAAEKGVSVDAAIPLLHADHPSISMQYIEDTVNAVGRGIVEDGMLGTKELEDVARDEDNGVRDAAGEVSKVKDATPDPKGTIKMNAKQMAGLTADMQDMENFKKMSKQVVKLARAINKEDPTISLDGLVDRVQEELDQFIEGAVSKEDIQKLVYGYGITTKPNGSKVSKNWRLLREHAGLLSKLTDLRKEIIPPKTGQQRESLSDDGRTLSAEVNQLLGKDLKHEDINNELKTQNDRLKSMLENSIADIEKANRLKGKLKERPTKFVINEENQILREQLSVLRKAYNIRTGTVDAKKLQAAMKAAQRSIDTLQAKLDNEYEKPTRTPLEATQELTDLRARMKELRDRYLASEHAPSVKEAQKKVAELEEHKRKGTLPPKPGESEAQNAHTAKLNEKIADLRKAIQNSNSGQKEKKLAQIDRLEKRIAESDFVPKIPTSELAATRELMELDFKLHTLRIEANKMVEAQRPKTLWGQATDVGVALRWLVAGGEMSAVLRQGGLYAMAHPKKAMKAIREDNIKAFKSSQGGYEAYMALMQRDNGELYRVGGLAILEEGSAKMKGEEMLASKWINIAGEWAHSGKGKKVPVAGHYMRYMENTARAYTAYLNRVRADWFDLLIQNVSNPGSPTVEEAKKVATAVNMLTGRGGEGMSLFEKAVPFLNFGLFAPRFQMSRIQILASPLLATGRSLGTKVADISPQTDVALAKFGFKRWNDLDAEISGLMLKVAGRMGVGGMAIMGLLAAAASTFLEDDEWGIEMDSKSSDYLKFRVGPVRFDPWGGLQQWFVFSSRVRPKWLGGGYTTAMKTRGGKDIKGSTKTFPIYGEDKPFAASSPLDLAWRKAKSSFSPLVAVPEQLFYGHNYFEEPTSRAELGSQLFTPMALGDMADMYHTDYGIPMKTATALAIYFGLGVQVHDED